MVVTGGPEEPMRRYATNLGFSLAGTLQLQVRDGLYTGGVLHNAGLRDKKREAVSRVLVGDRTAAMAFGDSQADDPLWQAAEVGFIVEGDARPLPPRLDLVPIDPASSGEDVVALVSQSVTQKRSL